MPSVKFDPTEDPAYLYVESEGGGVWVGIDALPALIADLTAVSKRPSVHPEES